MAATAPVGALGTGLAAMGTATASGAVYSRGVGGGAQVHGWQGVPQDAGYKGLYAPPCAPRYALYHARDYY